MLILADVLGAPFVPAVGDAGGSRCCARDAPPRVQWEPKCASSEFPIGCRAAVWCPRSRFASPVGYN